MVVRGKTPAPSATRRPNAKHAQVWNQRIGYNLRICDDVDISCRGRNSDEGIVTIRTGTTTKDNTHGGCPGSRACVTHGTYSGPPEDIGGKPRHNMEMIFHSPAYVCSGNEKSCTSPTKYVWTDNEKEHGDPVNGKDATGGIYAYVGYTLLHEFGHPFGLPDFYSSKNAVNWDPRLRDVMAIMNLPWEANGIKTQDIKQLHAIYIRHKDHQAQRRLECGYARL